MAKNILTFDKNFITSLDEGSFKRYILEVDVEYSKNIFYLDRDLPFSAEKKKIKNTIGLFLTYMTKTTMLLT